MKRAIFSVITAILILALVAVSIVLWVRTDRLEDEVKWLDRSLLEAKFESFNIKCQHATETIRNRIEQRFGVEFVNDTQGLKYENRVSNQVVYQWYFHFYQSDLEKAQVKVDDLNKALVEELKPVAYELVRRLFPGNRGEEWQIHPFIESQDTIEGFHGYSLKFHCQYTPRR